MKESAAPPYVVAEIASAHEGRPDLALRLFGLAAAAGADAVKFQIFRRDQLIARCHPRYAPFGEIELPAPAWRELLDEAGRGGVDIWLEIYDPASLALAEEWGHAAGYKLPASEAGQQALAVALGSCGRPVQLATGGTTLAEIHQALGWLSRGASPAVTLLHGFQNFPTRIEDCRLAQLTTLKREFGLPVGYADHVDAGQADLALAVPLMAVALGAVVIEKHITDDRSRKGRDYFSALHPDEFARMVRLLRAAQPALGQAGLDLSPAEQAYRDLMKRFAVAACPLEAGHCLRAEDITFLRTGSGGIAAADGEALIGRRLVRGLGAGAAITQDCLA
jgi:sialic acid synthase SpsE